MSLTDPHYWQRWLPVALGVFTGIFTVVHALVDQDSLLGYAQELTLPVALSLSLVFLGIRLARSDLDIESFSQINTWIAIGMAAFGFLGIWLFAHRVLMEGLPE